MAETVAYVNRARAFMPPGTVPPFVMRFDAGSVPVGYLVFSSDNPEQSARCRTRRCNRVRPLFATLPGVSAPPPFGGQPAHARRPRRPRAPARPTACRPDEVIAAMTAANTISPPATSASAT